MEVLLASSFFVTFLNFLLNGVVKIINFITDYTPKTKNYFQFLTEKSPTNFKMFSLFQLQSLTRIV
jgi:fumarate reductase subunit C